MDGATSIRGEKGQPRRKGNSYSAAKLGTKRAEKQSSRKQASGAEHDEWFEAGAEIGVQEDVDAELNGETPYEGGGAAQHVGLGRPLDLAVRTKPTAGETGAIGSSTLVDSTEISRIVQPEAATAEPAKTHSASDEVFRLRDMNKQLEAQINNLKATLGSQLKNLEASLELYKARNKALEGKVLQQEHQIHQNNVDISDMTTTSRDLMIE